VRAPVAGRVVENKVAPGEYKSDLAEPLMTIADLSVPWSKPPPSGTSTCSGEPGGAWKKICLTRSSRLP